MAAVPRPRVIGSGVRVLGELRAGQGRDFRRATASEAAASSAQPQGQEFGRFGSRCGKARISGCAGGGLSGAL